jgi:hypothetical protein
MPMSRSSRPPTSADDDTKRSRNDGGRGEPDPAKAGVRANGGTSYERYKQQLHAFFNGDKPLPDHLRTMLATRPGAQEHGFSADEEPEHEAPASAPAPTGQAGRSRSKKKQPAVVEDATGRRRVVAGAADDVVLADAIRRASSPREVQTAIDAFLARGYPLPMDPDVLGKALGHSDDDVLEKALAGLLTLVNEGNFKGNATLLKTRIKNVALLSSSSAVRDLCGSLTTRL